MNKTALTIVALAVLGGLIVFAINRKSSSTQKADTGKLPDDFPPKPKWKPNVPVNLQKTIETFAYYSDKKKSFAVFKNGTCVVISDSAVDQEKLAKEILNKVYNYHPDFNPQTMDDGNYMISYSQPAYSVVFKEEFEKNRDYIEQNHLDGLVRAEVLLNSNHEANKFDDIGKIGLFARARMFLDAQDPVVVEIWKPAK
jgi:hypothetical protein